MCTILCWYIDCDNRYFFYYLLIIITTLILTLNNNSQLLYLLSMLLKIKMNFNQIKLIDGCHIHI